MERNYKELYDNMKNSEFFKKHYEGKSLGDSIDVTDEKEIVKKFTEELVNNQVDIPGEIHEIVNDNFWDLVEGAERPITSQAVDDNFFDALEDGWHLWPDDKPKEVSSIYEGEWMVIHWMLDQCPYYAIAKYVNGKWRGQDGEEYYSDDINFWMPFKNV